MLRRLRGPVKQRRSAHQRPFSCVCAPSGTVDYHRLMPDRATPEGTLRTAVDVGIPLLAVFFVSILVYLGWNALDDWAVNAGVTALAIAITITVIDWIISRERVGRERQRAARALWEECRGWTECVACSWALMADLLPYQAPPDADTVTRVWLVEHDEALTEQRFMQAPDADALIRAAVTYARVLGKTEALYRESLPIPLVEGIEHFTEATQHAEELFGSQRSNANDPTVRGYALAAVVKTALRLGEAVARIREVDSIPKFQTPFEGARGRVWRAYDAARQKLKL